MIGEVPKFGQQEPVLLQEGHEKEVKAPEQKTERVARGIFGNIKHWYENEFKPWLERSWKWIVGALAAIVAAVVGVALAVWLTNKERRPAAEKEASGAKVASGAPAGGLKETSLGAVAEAEKPEDLKRPASQLFAKQPSAKKIAKAPPEAEKSAAVKAEIIVSPSQEAAQLPPQKNDAAPVQAAAVLPVPKPEGQSVPSAKDAAIKPEATPVAKDPQAEEKRVAKALPPEAQSGVVVVQASGIEKVEISLAASKPVIKKEGVPQGQVQKKVQLISKQPIGSQETEILLPEQKLPGKLNIGKLALSINPKALLPGAVKPPAALPKSEAAHATESQNADQNLWIEIHKSKPKMQNKKPPTRRPAKPKSADAAASSL